VVYDNNARACKHNITAYIAIDVAVAVNMIVYAGYCAVGVCVAGGVGGGCSVCVDVVVVVVGVGRMDGDVVITGCAGVVMYGDVVCLIVVIRDIAVGCCCVVVGFVDGCGTVVVVVCCVGCGGCVVGAVICCGVDTLLWCCRCWCDSYVGGDCLCVCV